jgi:exopolysaccharide biosynthesis protein
MKRHIFCSLLLLSPLAFSQDIALQLSHCRAIKDNDQRLACYDALSSETSNSVAIATPKTTPAAQAMVSTPAPTTNVESVTSITERFSEFFGFEEKEIAKHIPDSMVVEVASVSSNGSKLVIKMTNGQVWQQTDSKPYNYRDENGQPYIQRGALGSFFFSQKGVKTRIRVKRQY